MKRILITAMGGDIGQSVAQCFRESYLAYAEEIFLIGTDIFDKHGGSLFVDDFFIVPSAEDPDYLNTIKNIVYENNIDVIIPINENELKVLINVPHNLNLIHCGNKMVNNGLDKLATIEMLKTLDIEVPWTKNADNDEPISFPCLMKPRFSSGSKSLFVINSLNEAKSFSVKFPNCVFQEMLEPFTKEITCALYKTKTHEFTSIQFERLLVGGLTGWARVIKDDAVTNLLGVIADGLDFKGSINVQLRITKKGPLVFEINPRFSSTAYMRHKLGFTDVLWSVNEFFNEPIKLKEVSMGTTLVRNQDVMVLKDA